MSTAVKAKAVRVEPIEFKILVNAQDRAEYEKYIDDLSKRHPCINKPEMLRLWEFDEEYGCAYYVSIVLHDDADYQQLCALRAELKA